MSISNLDLVSINSLVENETALTDLVAMNLQTLPIVCAYGIVVSDSTVPSVPITVISQTIAGFPQFINTGMNLFVQLIPMDFGAIVGATANLVGIIPVGPPVAAPPAVGTVTWNLGETHLQYAHLNENDNGITYLVNVIIKN